MWYTFNGGDGFVTAQDPTNADIIYGESQGGNIGRYVVSTGERFGLAKPHVEAEVHAVGRFDRRARGRIRRRRSRRTTRSASTAIRAQQKRDSIDLDMRWNWNTPFFISKHNPQVLYFGANRVLKSTKSGDEMYPISPDLSYADTTKIRVSTQTTGGITTDATGAETFANVVSLNESPIRRRDSFRGHGRRPSLGDVERRRQLERPHQERRRAFRPERMSRASSRRTSTRSRST